MRFAGMGRSLSRVYIGMFLPGTISPGTICKVSIISSQQSGTVYMIKIVPLLSESRFRKPVSHFAGTGRKY